MDEHDSAELTRLNEKAMQDIQITTGRTAALAVAMSETVVTFLSSTHEADNDALIGAIKVCEVALRAQELASRAAQTWAILISAAVNAGGKR